MNHYRAEIRRLDAANRRNERDAKKRQREFERQLKEQAKLSAFEQARLEVEAHENALDVLLSVHNNSLPDGRDPLTEHGTSSYWYHPQSIALAHSINNGMVQDVGFPDFGSRFQNLALTRPSAMLACLAEVGFVINPEEYATLISPEGQQRAAEGLLKGLLAYLHPPAPVKH